MEPISPFATFRLPIVGPQVYAGPLFNPASLPPFQILSRNLAAIG